MNVEDMMYHNLSLDTLKYSSLPVPIIYPLVFHSKNGKKYVLDNIKGVFGDNVIVKEENEDFIVAYNHAFQLAHDNMYENFYVCIPGEDFESVKNFLYNEYYNNKDFPRNISVLKACDTFEGSEFSNTNQDFDRLVKSEQEQKENPSQYRQAHERMKAYVSAIREDRLTDADLQQLMKDVETENSDEHVYYSGYSYLVDQIVSELLRKKEKYEDVLISFFHYSKPELDSWIDPEKNSTFNL